MQNSPNSIIAILKSPRGSAQIPLSIPVGTPVQAFLRPVSTDPEHINLKDVQLLTQYRNRFVKSFLTEFKATETQTKSWLMDSVRENPSKILFMLDDVNRNTFGYMGIDFIDWKKSYCEADAIVRGTDDAPKGIMPQALITLLKWAHSQLGIQNIGVRVLSDNKAVDFYKKVGFIEQKRVPMKKTETSVKITWLEDEQEINPEKYLVHMMLQKEI